MAQGTPQEKKLRVEMIEALIAGANGTDDYHKSSAFTKSVFHTDSIQYVMEAAQSFWLLDAIVSHLPSVIKNYGGVADFQVWKLEVSENQSAVLTCTGEYGEQSVEMARQEIPFTTFPLKSFECWVEKGSADGVSMAYIIMLPGDR